MLYNIKVVYLHCVFHGIRFKVNEDWESGKIPFFFFTPNEAKMKKNVFCYLFIMMFFFGVCFLLFLLP